MLFVEEKMFICIDFVKYYMSWKNITVNSIKISLVSSAVQKSNMHNNEKILSHRFSGEQK